MLQFYNVSSINLRSLHHLEIFASIEFKNKIVKITKYKKKILFYVIIL